MATTCCVSGEMNYWRDGMVRRGICHVLLQSENSCHIPLARDTLWTTLVHYHWTWRALRDHNTNPKCNKGGDRVLRKQCAIIYPICVFSAAPRPDPASLASLGSTGHICLRQPGISNSNVRVLLWQKYLMLAQKKYTFMVSILHLVKIRS